MPGCQTVFQHLLALKSKSGLEDAGFSMWAACVPWWGEEDIHFLCPYLDKWEVKEVKRGQERGQITE